MANSIVKMPDNEYFTISSICEVASADYCNFVQQPCTEYTVKKFVEQNELAIYLLCNTWCLLVEDLVDVGLSTLLYYEIKSKGLAATIRSAAITADLYTRNIHAGRDGSSDITSKVVGTFAYEAAKQPPKIALQILQYAGRFAPVVPKEFSVLSKKAMDDFLTTNRFNGTVVVPRLQRFFSDLDSHNATEHGYYVAALVARRIIHSIVGDYDGVDWSSIPRFGPGSVRNCTNSTYHKYEYLFRLGVVQTRHPVYMVTPLTVHPDLDVRRRRDNKGRWRKGNLDTAYLGSLGRFPQVTRPTTVPKKVTTDRVVSPEDTYNQAFQLKLMSKLEERIRKAGLSRSMPIRDQEQQRKLAYVAALTGSLATVDLSHASDSVTKVLVQWLFPQSWWRAFAQCIPYGFITEECDRTIGRLHCFATMGCGCTFIVETLVFYALTAGLAVYCAYRSGDLRLRDLRDLNFNVMDRVSAMGDDIICPNKLVPVLRKYLAFLGFSVNDDKTFNDGLFRESCGANWLRDANGVLDLSVQHWPRLPVKGSWDRYVATAFVDHDSESQETKTAMRKIVALQHHLYAISRKASDFLVQSARTYAPCLSVGLPDDTDLGFWGNPDTYAVFVGESVPEQFRRLSYDQYIPDTYVLQSCLAAYNEWRVKEGLEIVEHTTEYRRVVVTEFGVGVGEPKDVIIAPLMESLRLELYLSDSGSASGFPDVYIVGNATDSHRTLADLCGLRPRHLYSAGRLGGSRRGVMTTVVR